MTPKFFKKIISFVSKTLEFSLTNDYLSYIIVRLDKGADMAQMVERVLGKDEVTGSIPVISSI